MDFMKKQKGLIYIRKGFLPLLLFSILYFSFVVQDMQASRQMLIIDANRSNVHLLLIILGIYVILACLVNVPYLTRINSFTTILLFESVWIFIVDRYLGVSISSALVREAMPFLWIFVYLFFYIYGNKYSINKKYIKIFLVLMLIIFSGGLIYYSTNIFLTYGRYQVMNVIYNILVLVPWAFVLLPDKWFKRYNAIVVILTFISLKRGAIIALIALLFVQLLMSKDRSAKKIIGFIAAVIGILLIYYFVDQSTGGLLSARFEADNFLSGSGRSNQYQLVIRDLNNRPFNQLLLGKGTGYSISIFGTGIHNEWLEVISSYGIIGLLLYFAMFISFIISAKKQNDSKVKKALIQMIVLIFFLSMVSTVYFGYISIQVFAFLGIMKSNMISSSCEKPSTDYGKGFV